MFDPNMLLHRRRRLCVFGRFGAFGAHFCVFGRFGAFGADFCVILGVSAPPAPIFVCFRVFRRLRRRFVCVFGRFAADLCVCVLGRFGADFVCIVEHERDDFPVGGGLLAADSLPPTSDKTTHHNKKKQR